MRADAEEQFYVANNPRLPCQRRVNWRGQFSYDNFGLLLS
jgi:hypothetical protein